MNDIHVFVGTAEALAAEVTQENLDKGLIFPPFTNIRKISSHIAAKVAAKAYELGKMIVHQIHLSDNYSQGSSILTDTLPRYLTYRKEKRLLFLVHKITCALYDVQVWQLVSLNQRILSPMQKVACTAPAIEAIGEAVKIK